MRHDRLINQLIAHPNRLFLIDSLGALLTTFYLLGVLRPLKHLFGMPQHILLLLSIPAGVFALYSGCCYLFVGSRWRPLLRVISVANLLYCCVTAGLVIAFYSQLTALGVAYFVLEIGVVCTLVFIEQRAIANLAV